MLPHLGDIVFPMMQFLRWVNPAAEAASSSAAGDVFTVFRMTVTRRIFHPEDFSPDYLPNYL